MFRVGANVIMPGRGDLHVLIFVCIWPYARVCAPVSRVWRLPVLSLALSVPHGEVPFCIREWDAGRYLINTIDYFA